MTGTSDGVRVLGLGDAVPDVHPETFLAAGVTVVGDVVIAARASIWYGAVLRGDGDRIEVGAGSNVQDNCVLHADRGFPLRLGNGVTVGHGAVLHGCRVGDHSLIGMGAVVMNGAEIGSESMVAAGTVVLEGTGVPARSLIAGVPGKVRRTLTEDEIARMRDSARIYEALRQRHAEPVQYVADARTFLHHQQGESTTPPS